MSRGGRRHPCAALPRPLQTVCDALTLYGAQRLETRLRDVDVVELEDLDADRSAVTQEGDGDEDGLEVAALGVRSEPACHHEATMLRARDGVERLGPEIVAQLPE